MSPDTIAWVSGVVVIVFSAIIENLSTKFKPWSWIAKQIGRAINAETNSKIDALSRRIEALEKHDTRQEASSNQDKAEDARRRIINFADELRRHLPHSLENFNSILDDITFYEQYCHDHAEFKNEKAVRSITIIDEIYDECVRNNSFL